MGGGHSALSRLYGLGVDNVRSLRVVRAVRGTRYAVRGAWCVVCDAKLNFLSSKPHSPACLPPNQVCPLLLSSLEDFFFVFEVVMMDTGKRTFDVLLTADVYSLPPLFLLPFPPFPSFFLLFLLLILQVVEFEVVVASGAIVVANKDRNAELFWALRGGGGGTFGIVTNMTVLLRPDPGELTVLTQASSDNSVTHVTHPSYWESAWGNETIHP